MLQSDVDFVTAAHVRWLQVCSIATLSLTRVGCGGAGEQRGLHQFRFASYLYTSTAEPMVTMPLGLGNVSAGEKDIIVTKLDSAGQRR